MTDETMKALDEARKLANRKATEKSMQFIDAYEHFAQLVLAENKQKDERIKELGEHGTDAFTEVLRLKGIIKRAREKIILSQQSPYETLIDVDDILSEAFNKQEEHHG